MKIDISELWDNMTIDDKIKILRYNYPFDYLLYRQVFIDICKEKFNDLSDIKYVILKNVIINNLKGG